MGVLMRFLMSFSSGAGALFEWLKTCNIFSDHNLCSSIPFEKFVAQLTSIATLSITEIRLVAQPSTINEILNYLATLELPLTLSSTYNLSTAVT